MKMHITKEIFDMVYDRDMVENLKKEAQNRAEILKCNVYVYYCPDWCNATIVTEYKGEENLFFKIEK